ncbi:Mucin-associated surface protein (MASP), subgroup S027 [Trypanosoma cruzi]|nr:Mucin-associated surface protein (MASP), subgroup S027 [Trypanosoma cruzi]
MAMMMTGRVLLVCALCVLWYGGAALAADDFITSRNDGIGDMVLTWYQPTKDDCERKSMNDGKLDKTAFKSCVHAAMKTVCYDYYNETPTEFRDSKSVEICNNYTGDTEETIDTSTPLTEPSHDAEKTVASQTPETSKFEAAEMGSPPGVPAGDSPANPTEGPQLTSPATDTANNEAEKDGKEVMPNNAPESNATRKGEEGEKKHSNTKTTPVDAEAKKNITTADSDSDGSTAVSHTTSPLLLLLLVVACAAAAAVVAA